MGTHETDMGQCGRSDSPFRGGERRDRSRSPSPPARDISSLHSCELPESKDATIARLRAELQKIKAVPHEMETELQNEREAHRRTKEQLTREQEKNANPSAHWRVQITRHANIGGQGEHPHCVSCMRQRRCGCTWKCTCQISHLSSGHHPPCMRARFWIKVTICPGRPIRIMGEFHFVFRYRCSKNDRAKCKGRRRQ